MKGNVFKKWIVWFLIFSMVITHKLHGEGHFAARLVKAGTPQPACEVLPTVSAKKSKKKQRDKAVDLTDYKEFEKEQQEKKLIKQLKKEQKKKIKENKRKNGRAKK